MTTALGEKIRRLRKKKGYSLDKLAELTESSKSYIWELENKKPPRPSADKLGKIAVQLDTTIDYLLDSEEAISPEDAADTHFYRQYRKMSPTTKAKIRQMVKLWGDEYMSSSFSPERWAFDITHVLNAALGVEHFPIDVPTVAKEISARKFPDDPIVRVVGDRLPGFDGALYRAPAGKKGWGIFYNSAIRLSIGVQI